MLLLSNLTSFHVLPYTDMIPNPFPIEVFLGLVFIFVLLFGITYYVAKTMNTAIDKRTYGGFSWQPCVWRYSMRSDVEVQAYLCSLTQPMVRTNPTCSGQESEGIIHPGLHCPLRKHHQTRQVCND